MRDYDPSCLLVSIHIPKCAGTAFGCWLRNIFQDNLHMHYPDERPPRRINQDAGWCVHGHFYHHEWAIGAQDYYPSANQFITVLRDPLEMLLSSFYYQTKLGDQPFTNIEAYLEQVLNCPYLFPYLNLPFDINLADPWVRIEQDFVWVGVLERIEKDLPLLAEKLGMKLCPTFHNLNASQRAGRLRMRSAWEERLRENFTPAYRLYDRAIQELDILNEA